jgi:hypothetical protein
MGCSNARACSTLQAVEQAKIQSGRWFSFTRMCRGVLLWSPVRERHWCQAFALTYSSHHSIAPSAAIRNQSPQAGCAVQELFHSVALKFTHQITKARTRRNIVSTLELLLLRPLFFLDSPLTFHLLLILNALLNLDLAVAEGKHYALKTYGEDCRRCDAFACHGKYMRGRRTSSKHRI